MHLKEENEQKRVDELKQYLDQKISEHQKLMGKQVKHKVSSCAISFRTLMTKVVTSETCLAQLNLYKEWKSTKILKKRDLIKKMITNYGFLENDLQTNKVPELKQLTEQYLLGREKKLVEVYQKELDSVTVPLPPSISNFFQHPLSLEEKNEERVDVIEDGNIIDDMEDEILSYLTQKMNGEEEEDTAKEAALLSLFFNLS